MTDQHAADASGFVAPAQPSPVLEVRDLHKSYGPVRAVRGVSFGIQPGEVVGLLGDNGAGKSTVVRCIAGLTTPDSGVILVQGKQVAITSPRITKELGIETVHQDLMLVGALDVAGNMFLNREIRSKQPILRQLGWLDKKAMQRETEQILDRLRIRLPSTTATVEVLSGGQRQAIAVGRAVSWGQKLVLMDEPVAALGVEQSHQVLELVSELHHHGVAVVFISHNMQQVMNVCSRALVMMQGYLVGNVAIRDVTSRDLVDLITGATVPRDENGRVIPLGGDPIAVGVLQ